MKKLLVILALLAIPVSALAVTGTWKSYLINKDCSEVLDEYDSKIGSDGNVTMTPTGNHYWRSVADANLVNAPVFAASGEISITANPPVMQNRTTPPPMNIPGLSSTIINNNIYKIMNTTGGSPTQVITGSSGSGGGILVIPPYMKAPTK